MRKLKRLFNVVGADDLVPKRLAQGAIIVERFVDDVPAVDFSLVTADDRVDVVLHPRQQSIAVEEIALVVVKNPGRNLAVPDEIVSHDEHVVLLTKGDVLVRQVEIDICRVGDGCAPT